MLQMRVNHEEPEAAAADEPVGAGFSASMAVFAASAIATLLSSAFSATSGERMRSMPCLISLRDASLFRSLTLAILAQEGRKKENERSQKEERE